MYDLIIYLFFLFIPAGFREKNFIFYIILTRRQTNIRIGELFVFSFSLFI